MWNVVVGIIIPLDLTGVKESSVCTQATLVSHVVRGQTRGELGVELTSKLICLICLNLHQVHGCRKNYVATLDRKRLVNKHISPKPN
jgi:hypothetical protein